MAGETATADGPRTAVVEFRCDGELWHASSPDIGGLEAEHRNLAVLQGDVLRAPDLFWLRGEEVPPGTWREP